jgi:cell division protein FtsL
MAENEFIDKEQAEKESKKVEQKVNKSKPKSSKPSAFAQILNGDFLTREFVLNNLNFIFFIILLLLLIVGKGYYGKQLAKDVDTVQKELDEMTADYIESKAKLEEVTRRFKLVEKLGPRGLKESENTIKVIQMKKAKN